MLQTYRERLTVLFIALLPLHAFLVTVGTRILAGSNQSPLTYLSLWKEAFLGILLLVAVIEILHMLLKKKEELLSYLQCDLIDFCILGLLLLGIFISLTTHGSLSLFVYGFRYDFVPLFAFFLLRRVPWSQEFKELAEVTLLSIGSLVVLIGLVFLFLPQSIFTWLGYSDLHSLYVPGGPIAAFQQIGELSLRRMQSTMSGPNQLGLWLLIPMSVCIVGAIRCHIPKSNLLQRAVVWSGLGEKQSCIPRYLFFLFLLGVVLTFSRSAWIAAFGIGIYAMQRQFEGRALRRRIVRLVGLLTLGIALVALLNPTIIIRTASSIDHVKNPLEALQMIRTHPLGIGLGTAGPASNRVSDACVKLPQGADASWAADRPNLCVFVGEQQVQPLSRTCRCPFLPENWYLQLGVEMGIAGMLLFIVLVYFMLQKFVAKHQTELGEAVLLSFVGISVAAVLLHAWEDSAVAYTLWALAAAFAAHPVVQKD